MSALTPISMRLPEQPSKTGKIGPGALTAPSVVWDAENSRAYAYGCCGTLAASDDLINWKPLELKAEDKPLQPGMTRVQQMFQKTYEYRCYSVKPQANGASIVLTAARQPEGPYLKRGIVLTTKDGEDAEAIQPQPVADPVTNKQYLLYGGNGRIFLLNLNPTNGMAYETGLGVCVARRPSWAGAVRATSLVYNEETKYYYLCLTYGNDTDANIRIGRSSSITGPYVDYMGRSLLDVNDFELKNGTMIAAGYRLDDMPGWKALAAGRLFQAGDKWMLAHTARSADAAEAELQVRQVVWTADGWPVVSPELYAGEEQQEIKVSDLPGRYELVTLEPRVPQAMLCFVKMEILTPSMPGVSSTRNDWAFKIPGDSLGRVELGGSHRGSWIVTGPHTLEIRYPNFTQSLEVLPAWDWELNEPTIVLTGLDSKGQAIWAKRRDLPLRRRP